MKEGDQAKKSVKNLSLSLKNKKKIKIKSAVALKKNPGSSQVRVLRSYRPSSCSMLDASTVFRCARVCSKYWSDATHPHTLDATPLSRHATLPQVPRYGVHERSEHGGLERVQRTFRTGCVRCSRQLRPLVRSSPMPGGRHGRAPWLSRASA